MEKSYSEFGQRFRDVEKNLKTIRERIAEAAAQSGRAPEDIALLAATKTVPAEVINHAVSLGVQHIGENRVQELEEKYDAYDLAHCDLQFIGHLQTNKVKYLVGRVSMIQSVGNAKLAGEISRLYSARGLTADILVEVNIGEEPNKSGAAPAELGALLEQIAPLPAVRVRGLMAIPPANASERETMNYFFRMHQYFVDIKAQKTDNIAMDYLSMGMSSDYPLAIRSGANMVRIGTALFGPRNYPE